MSSIIDLRKNIEVSLHLNEVCQQVVHDTKSQLFNKFKNKPQKIMVSHYFRIINELCCQAGTALLSSAYSTAEVLTRVIIEQSANQLYISLDEGNRAHALLKSSASLTRKNGKNWMESLESQGLNNPCAKARMCNGEMLVSYFDTKWPNIEHYPKVKEIFKKLGWDNHYHSFYAPLCDSVHSYSDDMANLIVFYEMSHALGDRLSTVLNAGETERRRLAVYNFVIAIALRSEVLIRIYEKLDIALLNESLDLALNDLKKVIDCHELYDRKSY